MCDKETQTQQQLTTHSPRKMAMRKKMCSLRSVLSSLREKQVQTKLTTNTATTLTIDEIIDAAKNYLPQNLTSFFASQLKLHLTKPKGRRYNSNARSLFLSIYYYSPRCYRFLSKCFAFPHKSTLARWLKGYCNTGPEIQDQIVETLKLKAEDMSSFGRLCVICMDEISLKPNLFYDKKSDKIIGFEDFGNNNRTPAAANSALVFMARGILYNWKQPLGYALTSGPCKKERIRSLLFSILEKLSSIGMTVLAVVSDQGSNFMALYASLGVTVDKPYFEHDEIRYFVVFDSPHLIKSIRNNFHKYDVTFHDKVATWGDIVEAYKKDSAQKFRCMPRLTERHINLPPFSKMNVSLAAQVLSSTVAATIETYVSFGFLTAKAIATAEFCSMFDTISDCVNSCSKSGPKVLRRAWTPDSKHGDVVNNFLLWLNACKFWNRKDGKEVTERMKCVKGWKISLKSLLMIWEFLKTNYEVSFLLTRRFNQDCLENLFGSIRSSNGCAKNPTPIQFCKTFRHVAMHELLQTKKGNANCEEDDDNLLISKLTELSNVLSVQENVLDRNVQSEGNWPVISYFSDNEVKKLSIPEKNALHYVSGFVLRKCLTEHTCEECVKLKEHEILPTNETMFLYFKEYDQGNLVSPTETFVTYIGKLEEKFSRVFLRRAHHGSLGKNILNEMKSLEPLSSCFPTNFLMKYYTSLRIYYTVKFFNKKLNNNEFKGQKFFSVPLPSTTCK